MSYHRLRCQSYCCWFVFCAVVCATSTSFGSEPSVISLPPAVRAKCIQVLQAAVRSDDFWPSMHAAEALTRAGHAAEVRGLLAPRLARETDDQHRCGLARELVRAGDRAKMAIMLDILAKPDPYAHGHACESLYKVNEIGDGRLLLATMRQKADPRGALMAAAALGRWGCPEAMRRIRSELNSGDAEQARVAAWILGRIGDPADIPALRAAARRYTDPLAAAYFSNALAALGDPSGLKHLARNLTSNDPAIRTYAATFAADARAVGLEKQLVAMLDDPHLDARLRAAESLLLLAQPPVDVSHRVIVTDPYAATAQCPRYSEGSVIMLNNGDLLFAITEFQNSASDFGSAHIVARRSSDHGSTWEPAFELQKNTGRQNVMSVTLRRLAPPQSDHWPLGMFYLVKNSPHDLKVVLRTSDDEGKTFSKPVVVTPMPGYHVMNNDRVLRMADGRLIAPVASTGDVVKTFHFIAHCFLSDDAGRSWHPSRTRVDCAKRGAMEPDVVELDNGQLLMVLRTQLGYIAVSRSHDRGETWSMPVSWHVRAPEAPATVRRVPSTGDLLLIWNDTFVPGAGHGGPRRPLTLAISTDGGKTWQYKQNIEAAPNESYAYTSAVFEHGCLLLTYYVRNDKTGRISARFRSIPIALLYEKK